MINMRKKKRTKKNDIHLEWKLNAHFFENRNWKKKFCHIFIIPKKNYGTSLKMQRKKSISNQEKKFYFLYSFIQSRIHISLYLSISLYFSQKNSGFYNWRSSSFFFISPLSISSTCCCRRRRLIKYSNDSHFFYVIIITFHLNMTRFISYSISHHIQQQQQRKSCRKQE